MLLLNLRRRNKNKYTHNEVVKLVGLRTKKYSIAGWAILYFTVIPLGLRNTY